MAEQGSFSFEYDEKNRTNICKGENGYLLSITYDEFGRIISSTDNFGTKEVAYNDLNQRTSETDREGNRTAYEYDENGNVTAVQYPDGTTQYM